MNLLKKWLDERDFSYEDAGRLLRTNPASICRWANNKCRPRASHAARIEKITNGFVPITSWGYYILPSGKITEGHCPNRRNVEEKRKSVVQEKLKEIMIKLDKIKEIDVTKKRRGRPKKVSVCH